MKYVSDCSRIEVISHEEDGKNQAKKQEKGGIPSHEPKQSMSKGEERRVTTHLETSVWLITVGVDPETVGLIFAVAQGEHAGRVPASTTSVTKVSTHGILVATAVVAVGRGDPGNADGIIVGGEERVRSLVVVLNSHRADIAGVNGAGVAGHADKVAVQVPDTTFNQDVSISSQ